MYTARKNLVVGCLGDGAYCIMVSLALTTVLALLPEIYVCTHCTDASGATLSASVRRFTGF
jgi:hypothetical protein